MIRLHLLLNDVHNRVLQNLWAHQICELEVVLHLFGVEVCGETVTERPLVDQVKPIGQDLVVVGGQTDSVALRWRVQDDVWSTLSSQGGAFWGRRRHWVWFLDLLRRRCRSLLQWLWRRESGHAWDKSDFAQLLGVYLPTRSSSCLWTTWLSLLVAFEEAKGFSSRGGSRGRLSLVLRWGRKMSAAAVSKITRDWVVADCREEQLGLASVRMRLRKRKPSKSKWKWILIEGAVCSEAITAPRCKGWSTWCPAQMSSALPAWYKYQSSLCNPPLIDAMVFGSRKSVNTSERLSGPLLEDFLIFAGDNTRTQRMQVSQVCPAPSSSILIFITTSSSVIRLSWRFFVSKWRRTLLTSRLLVMIRSSRQEMPHVSQCWNSCQGGLFPLLRSCRCKCDAKCGWRVPSHSRTAAWTLLLIPWAAVVMEFADLIGRVDEITLSRRLFCDFQFLHELRQQPAFPFCFAVLAFHEPFPLTLCLLYEITPAFCRDLEDHLLRRCISQAEVRQIGPWRDLGDLGVDVDNELL